MFSASSIDGFQQELVPLRADCLLLGIPTWLYERNAFILVSMSRTLSSYTMPSSVLFFHVIVSAVGEFLI
jgi:hypothetical protein